MSMMFLLDFYGVSMEFLGILMGLLWHPSGISMMFFLIFLWASSGIPLGFRVPIGILLDLHKVSMEPLWHFNGIPMGLFGFSI